MKFTHRELNNWNRVLGPAVLECVDPNDNARRRHQYSLCNSSMMVRSLPADSDYWIDPGTGKRCKRSPPWEQLSIDALQWPLLAAWYESIGLPSPWSMGGSTAFSRGRIVSWVDGEPVYASITMLTMRSLIEIDGTDWPQMFPCPHCHDWIVWAEAGYVPGYRICRGCHRHWRTTLDSNTHSCWTLKRVNHVRFWPYRLMEANQ
jgi:hypothetical protein